MSLEYDIEEFPELWSQSLVDAVENYKNGERNSARKLRKFVKREISQCYYDELIERYGAFHHINKEKRKRKEVRKIKSIIAASVIFLSHFFVFGYVAIEYGKTIAIGYMLLSFWSFSHIND